MQSQLKNIFLAKETNRLHRNFSSVQSPVLNMPEATVERNNSLLTGRNLWQNQTQAIRLDQLGFERTVIRGKTP